MFRYAGWYLLGQIFWDLGFLAWGALILLGGWWMTRRNGPKVG
jgi:uncharacterized membrane protein